MSSRKKTPGIIITAIIITAIAFFILEEIDTNESQILDQIEFDAVYIESDQIVKIIFNDKTNKTQSGTLEILGMDVTYQEKYAFNEESNFIEEVSFKEVPKYGWKTTPITLEIVHSEFGKIGLKTEIYEPNQSPPKIIVERK